ncbi:MAG: methyltransferase domain-containing protein [Gemmatimonadetes bacterium]|nr:methyltransferase domain-containing protein [Gemmatimonadota bacterium]
MTAGRSLEPELLDAPVTDLQELAGSLRHVAQVNRWLGGTRALRRHLASLVRGDGTLRYLDVGTGNGETLTDIALWARRRGCDARCVGVDLRAEMLALAARADGTSVLRADALRLPFADGAFDAAACTLTLHHFGDDDAVALVGEMARVARSLVLVNDLERNAVNRAGARVLALTVWRGNRITRNDGPLSVRRSFTVPELLEIGRRAGLAHATVRRHFPWRLVLVGRP